MRHFLATAVITMLLASTGCNKPDPPPSSSDYSKPFLTRRHILNYIASLTEERRVRIRQGVIPPTGPTEKSTSGMLAEADEFARKYEFADYAEYVSIDERITLARGILILRKVGAVEDKVLILRVEVAKEKLLMPGLTPEESAAASQELNDSLAALKTPRSSIKHLNEQDVALVASYEKQISNAEAAAKGK